MTLGGSVSKRRVFATDLGIWPTFGNLAETSDAMVSSPDYWARVADYILLYDQIVIPTGNLQILPVLRLMLGEDVFNELILSKGIVLARFDQWFGYAGNGAGLVFYQVHDDPKKLNPAPNLGKSYFEPLDKAISDVLALTNPPSSPERKSELTKLLLDNVVALPMHVIVKDLIDEAYKDILNSPYLRDFMCVRNAGRSLTHLLGLGANQLKIFNPHVPRQPQESPEIHSVLRVAFENLLLSMGGHIEATDITGDESTLSILKAKGQRLGHAVEGSDAFARIQSVSGVPNLGAAFSSKQLSPGQLLDLRHSKHCQALRDWLALGSPTEAGEEVLRRYVESVGKPRWIDSIPAKLLRFASTTGIGAWEPAAGAVASVVNTFLLSKWFPSRSPRLFMQQAKVVLANTPVIQKPSMHGRDRNQPCSCGSGKKLKKCCGA